MQGVLDLTVSNSVPVAVPEGNTPADVASMLGLYNEQDYAVITMPEDV